MAEFVLYAILLAVVNFICGLFSSWLAEQKGYGGWEWMFFGFCFGIIALITIAGAPVRGAKPPAPS